MACLLCLTHEVAGGSRYMYIMYVKRLLQLLLGLLRTPTFPRTASIDRAVRKLPVPNPPPPLFFSLSVSFTLLHLLRLPLFHALSSHNTVGGAELKYLELLWAPLSGICPLLGCRKYFLILLRDYWISETRNHIALST